MTRDSGSVVVQVLSGIPGMSTFGKDHLDAKAPYPDTTPDFVKVLREHGLEVKFEHERDQRRYVGHKAAESWLPILQFASGVLTGAGGNLLTELIMIYIGGAKDATLHIHWRVRTAHGAQERAQIDGRASEVLEVAREFEQRFR